ncbi:response regulator transcription factor [Micromonospora sp. NPDC050686]|uniref:response regulator transcription factor n=1 Tax=Micromonospora sp. NPDC050686 TaxID=3154631 RepID=UPI0033EE3476
MAEQRTRILVADDQRDVRSGFRLVLDAQPDMVVVGEAADGVAAIGLARHLRPDVLLVDVRMPRLDGLEVARRLMSAGDGPEVRVIVVTTFNLDEYVTQALAYGVSGFLLKRSGPTLLVESVRAAMSGDVLLSPEVTVRLLRRLKATPAAEPGGNRLTEREVEIACQIAQGKTNPEIARELHLSAGTVKTHAANIQAKLQVRNRVGIAAWAWQTGVAR